jgi:hypothetical protein
MARSASASAVAASASAERGVRAAERVVARRGHERVRVLDGVVAGEDLVPHLEPHHRQVRRDQERVEERQVGCEFWWDRRGHVGRSLQGERAATLDAGRPCQEVQVVRVVEDRHQSLGLVGLEVRAIGDDGAFVRARSVVPAADPGVDVRRHVDHVADGDVEFDQAIGGAFGAFGCGRGLHRVDVVVVGARVVRVAFQDRLQRGDDLDGLGSRFTGCVPVVPRDHVHERLGEQRGGVEVVGVRRHDVAHRVGVGPVEVGAVLQRFGRVALGQRLDVRALPVAGVCGERQRALAGGVGRGHGVGRHGPVDVRPQGQRQPPVAHRARFVERDGGLERTGGLEVIEAEDEHQALVEVASRLVGLGRDRHRVIAEAVEEGNRGGRQLGVVAVRVVC